MGSDGPLHPGLLPALRSIASAMTARGGGSSKNNGRARDFAPPVPYLRRNVLAELNQREGAGTGRIGLFRKAGSNVAKVLKSTAPTLAKDMVNIARNADPQPAYYQVYSLGRFTKHWLELGVGKCSGGVFFWQHAPKNRNPLVWTNISSLRVEDGRLMWGAAKKGFPPLVAAGVWNVRWRIQRQKCVVFLGESNRKSIEGLQAGRLQGRVPGGFP